MDRGHQVDYPWLVLADIMLCVASFASLTELVGRCMARRGYWSCWCVTASTNAFRSGRIWRHLGASGTLPRPSSCLHLAISIPGGFHLCVCTYLTALSCCKIATKPSYGLLLFQWPASGIAVFSWGCSWCTERSFFKKTTSRSRWRKNRQECCVLY